MSINPTDSRAAWLSVCRVVHRNRENLAADEAASTKAKAGDRTFISTVLKARAEQADNVEVIGNIFTT